MKTSQLDDGLALDLSRPELLGLTCSGNADIGDAFASFIDIRQNAAHPITLTHRWNSPWDDFDP